MTSERIPEGIKAKVNKPETVTPEAKHEPSVLQSLPPNLGNRAVQRLLAQRSGDGPSELDEETAGRINRERGGGQSLDGTVQARMSEAIGHDFSGVKVHTSQESDTLNRQLGAKAFTTGNDVFFRSGAYEPNSSDGQQLISHELTHVVQQSSGVVDNGSRMTVNAPGDAHEQVAEAVSKSVVSNSAAAGVQRQAEEEEEVQTQEAGDQEEEEEVQTKADDEEEEESVA